MNFKEWLLFSESIEQNFDGWIEDIKKYAQPNELEIKTIQVDEKHKNQIIQSLKKHKQENQNHLKYLLGFIKNKPNALPEDFDRTLDALKWAIDSKKLTKQQISNDGWYNTGKKSYDIISMKDDASYSLKQAEKDKEQGIAPDLTPEFTSGNYKIYLIPKITENAVEKHNDFVKTKAANERHKLLCKYGKGTSWCTASPTGTYHANYAHKDIYVVHENDKPIYQFTGCTKDKNKDDMTCQFMDVDDNPENSIPTELANLIMEKLPDIGRFYEFINLTSNINKIESVEDILNIFDKQNINQLDHFELNNLFRYAKWGENNHKVAKIIAKSEKKPSNEIIMWCLKFSEDTEEIAKILGKENINSLSNKSISNLLELVLDKEEIARILGQDNIKKLTPDDVTKLSKAHNAIEIARILIKNQVELSANNVATLLTRARDIDKSSEILGTENFNKLDIDNIKELTNRKNIDINVRHIYMEEAIAKYKTNLTVKEIMFLLNNTTHKDRLAFYLGSEKISILNGADVKQILMYKTKDEMKDLAEVIYKYHNDNRVKKILKPFVNA